MAENDHAMGRPTAERQRGARSVNGDAIDGHSKFASRSNGPRLLHFKACSAAILTAWQCVNQACALKKEFKLRFFLLLTAIFGLAVPVKGYAASQQRFTNLTCKMSACVWYRLAVKMDIRTTDTGRIVGATTEECVTRHKGDCLPEELNERAAPFLSLIDR